MLLGRISKNLMLNITGSDISNLDDSQLRELVGRLCEAELNSFGLPTAGVTWGGDQDAADGGCDVRVEITDEINPDSFIPRSTTVYQVKKTHMTDSKVNEEMKPKGNLLEVIKELAGVNGAYIIVSGKSSTTDSVLQNKRQIMRENLDGLPNAKNIKIDFYDRERIAGWIRFHPAIALWVREKIGRLIQGWKPYGNWANCPGGVVDEYFFDEDIRLHNSSNSNSEGMSGVVGIQEIRKLLSQPASSIRLTGLSGVGKTRLLQALFDERIGENPLNKSQVFYTDISFSPNPSPRNVAEELIALKKPAILVVDNCPPTIHRQITSVCTASGSLVSLITVEYDVREDQPEETEVFRMEPASVRLIEKLIQSRFSYISQVNASSIADISGGNARIAIALAQTINKGENLSSLKDSELIDRLFLQRNDPDKKLQKVAEVCSLVYSFECNTSDEDDSEVKLLSLISDLQVKELYENISELKRRELVQQRGIWRAVLPHALSNTLAQRALENIPIEEIIKLFEQSGSERLLKSFSRRLSYLHECVKSKEIALTWLSKDGLLADVSNLNTLGINLLNNIAPIEPEAVLVSIEKAAKKDTEGIFLSRENVNYIEFTSLLCSLSYDAKLFNRSVKLLCKFALSESPKENHNSTRNVLKSLFYVKYSGTHATAEQRLSVIQELMNFGIEKHIELALELLDATLETGHFNLHHSYDFGAHSRDYGSYPKSRKDAEDWFNLFINFAVTNGVSENPSAIKFTALIAKKFRGLWEDAKMVKTLEEAVNTIIKKGTWREGWIAVKSTLRLKSDPSSTERLTKLAVLLEPSTLIEQVRLYALSKSYNSLDLTDAIEDEPRKDSYQRVADMTRSLGKDVANNYDILNEILIELLSSTGTRLYNFGLGLADGCDNPKKMWDTFKEKIISINTNDRNYQLLRGFLNGLSIKNPKITNEILDSTLHDLVFCEVFPILQVSVEIDAKAADRLIYALKNDIAPIWQYTNLAYGRSHETISDKYLCEILRLISSKEEGSQVAIEILQMRFHGNSDENILSPEIITLGQELLLNVKFSRLNQRSDHLDYGMGYIVKTCYVNDSEYKSAKILCKELATAIDEYKFTSMDYPVALEALASTQPRAFLDGFLDDEKEVNIRISRILSEDNGKQTKPLSKINDNLIIEWCEKNPLVRYPLIAVAIEPYKNSTNEDKMVWTTLAEKIIINASDPVVILNKFKASLRPSSWSGSRADIMQKRLCLISDLKNHENSLVSEWAERAEERFKEEILEERKWELERENPWHADESFE